MSGYNDDIDNPDNVPADDFGGDEQFDDMDNQSFDDDASADLGADENWDEQSDEMGDESERPTKPAKKKSGLIFYVIIGVVVVVGLGFVGMQFMGGAAPEQTEAPADATTATTEVPADGTAAVPAETTSTLADLRDESAPAETAPAPVPATEPVAAAPQGFMNSDPSSELPAPSAPVEPVPTLPATQALTAVDSTGTVPPTDDLPAPDTGAAPTSEDPAVISGLKPVSDFPSVDTIKKAGPTETVATPETAVPVPDVATPVPAVNAAEMTVLQGRLDAALAKVASLEKEVEAAKSASPTPVADTGKVEDLEAKVADLESQLKAKTAALKEAEASQSKGETQSTPVPDRVAAPSVTSRSDEPTSAPVVRKPRPAPVVSKVSWELRSAQPGKAMISHRGGSGDMISVSVGDSVAGLGTIRSIEKTGAGWVVRGTLGQVTQ